MNRDFFMFVTLSVLLFVGILSIVGINYALSMSPPVVSTTPQRSIVNSQVSRFESSAGFTVSTSPACSEKECVWFIRDMGGTLPVLELVTPRSGAGVRFLIPPGTGKE